MPLAIDTEDQSYLWSGMRKLPQEQVQKEDLLKNDVLDTLCKVLEDESVFDCMIEFQFLEGEDSWKFKFFIWLKYSFVAFMCYVKAVNNSSEVFEKLRSFDLNQWTEREDQFSSRYKILEIMIDMLQHLSDYYEKFLSYLPISRSVLDMSMIELLHFINNIVLTMMLNYENSQKHIQKMSIQENFESTSNVDFSITGGVSHESTTPSSPTNRKGYFTPRSANLLPQIYSWLQDCFQYFQENAYFDSTQSEGLQEFNMYESFWCTYFLLVQFKQNHSAIYERLNQDNKLPSWIFPFSKYMCDYFQHVGEKNFSTSPLMSENIKVNSPRHGTAAVKLNNTVSTETRMEPVEIYPNADTRMAPELYNNDDNQRIKQDIFIEGIKSYSAPIEAIQSIDTVEYNQIDTHYFNSSYAMDDAMFQTTSGPFKIVSPRNKHNRFSTDSTATAVTSSSTPNKLTFAKRLASTISMFTLSSEVGGIAVDDPLDEDDTTSPDLNQNGESRKLQTFDSIGSDSSGIGNSNLRLPSHKRRFIDDLCSALHTKNVEVVRNMLKQYGNIVNEYAAAVAKSSRRVIHKAYSTNNVDVMSEILHAFPTFVNQSSNKSRCTVLFRATRDKNIPMMKLLLAKGANPFKTNYLDEDVLTFLVKQYKSNSNLYSFIWLGSVIFAGNEYFTTRESHSKQEFLRIFKKLDFKLAYSCLVNSMTTFRSLYGLSLLYIFRSPMKVWNNLSRTDTEKDSILIRFFKLRLNELEGNILYDLITLMEYLNAAAAQNPFERADLENIIRKLESMMKEIFSCRSFDSANNVIILMSAKNLSSITAEELEQNLSTALLQYSLLDGTILKFCMLNKIKVIFENNQINALIENIFMTSLGYEIRIFDQFYKIELRSTVNKSESTFNIDLMDSTESGVILLYKGILFSKYTRECPGANFLLEFVWKTAFLILISSVVIEKYGKRYHTDYGLTLSSNESWMVLEYCLVGMIGANGLYELGGFIESCHDSFIQAEGWKQFLSILVRYYDGWNSIDRLVAWVCLTWVALRSTGQFSSARVVLSIAVIPLCFGMLRYLSVYRPLGQLVLMISAMIHELLIFLTFYIVCIMGFGISMYGLFNGLSDFSNSSYAFLSLIRYNLGNYDFSIFLGDNTNDIPPATNSTAVNQLGATMLLSFLVLTAVILMNLLIAQMTNSLNRIQGNSFREWSYARAYLVQHYLPLNRSAHPFRMLPPPFNLITSMIFLFDLITKTLWNLFWKQSNTEIKDEKDLENGNGRFDKENRVTDWIFNRLGMVIGIFNFFYVFGRLNWNNDSYKAFGVLTSVAPHQTMASTSPKVLENLRRRFHQLFQRPHVPLSQSLPDNNSWSSSFEESHSTSAIKLPSTFELQRSTSGSNKSNDSKTSGNLLKTHSNRFFSKSDQKRILINLLPSIYVIENEDVQKSEQNISHKLQKFHDNVASALEDIHSQLSLQANDAKIFHSNLKDLEEKQRKLMQMVAEIGEPKSPLISKKVTFSDDFEAVSGKFAQLNNIMESVDERKVESKLKLHKSIQNITNHLELLRKQLEDYQQT